MNALKFVDRGYDVVTSSWTVAAKKGKNATLCYTWGADGISMFNSATGVAQVVLKVPVGTFLATVTKRSALKNGVVVDITDLTED